MLAYFQRDSRRQYLQNAQHRRDHQPGLRPYPAPASPFVAPRMQPPPRPSALFPHSLIQGPRGFHLGRFSNAGRGRASTQRSAATRIRKPSPTLPSAMLSPLACSVFEAAARVAAQRIAERREIRGARRSLAGFARGLRPQISDKVIDRLAHPVERITLRTPLREVAVDQHSAQPVNQRTA